ncbi:hypothetical protein lerEdw1_001956 [Lerista edwardsae]|nr:hypothetical protein lerEdw1_001956 [Lerista edwardsae]
MEKLKGPMAAPFNVRNVTTLVGKFKHLALNTPLQFSGQALRAHTRSIARFGSLSPHNPHPHRVTHIQGLNGVPVCIVNDVWSKQAILCPHPIIKSHLCTSVSEVSGVQMPIGDPQPFPVPRLSVGSLSEVWTEELKELAARVRAAASTSTETVKKETILELLRQILQTDPLTAIQQWLLAAGQQEKNLVMGLLQIATAKQDLEPQELTTSIEEKFQSQSSPNATGIAFKQQSLGRNPIRLPLIRQKQEPVPKEDKPENLEAPSFQPGILYQYRYSRSGQLNYLSRLSLHGSKLSSEALVDVHLLWRNTNDAREQLLHVQVCDVFALYQFQIHDLQVHHEPEHKKNQTINSHPTSKPLLNVTELQRPLFIHWNNGKVEAIYEEQAGQPLMMELKRGLASLFQFQTQSGTVTEDDISGTCQVTYTVSKASILKTKDLRSCRRQKFGFSSVNKIFGILRQPTSKILYSVDGNLIKSVLSEESHVLSLTLKSSIGVNITSRQHLELLTQVPGSKEVHGKSLQEALVAAIPGKAQPIHMASEPLKRACTQCPTLKTYLKTLAKRRVRMDVAKARNTWRFQKVVQMLRDAKKRDILLLLKKAPEEMASFYVEAAVAAQSAASLTALSEFLDFGSPKQTPLLEKFLYAAAFSPRPSKDLLRLVLDKLNGKKPDASIWETGNIVIGSLVGKLCQMKLCELQDVRQGIETVLQRLNNAKSDSEKVVYLLSLSNALLPEAIPALLRYAEEGSASVSAAAVSALQRYPAQHISSTITIEAKGLEGILGGNTAEEDDTEFMAGMSSVLLDVQLRPVTFFQGYADLMSKFFSSTGEPTNVVKGNVLLMDHQQAIPLQSGLQAVVTLQGGLGLDVSADINVNMWEQEFKTNTKTRGALTIDFQAEMDAPFFQATVKHQTEVEMATNFNTVTRLSESPILMCLQLTEKQVSYREFFLVSESSENHSLTVRKGRKATVPGREVPLHRANSEMCRILLAEQ